MAKLAENLISNAIRDKKTDLAHFGGANMTYQSEQAVEQMKAEIKELTEDLQRIQNGYTKAEVTTLLQDVIGNIYNRKRSPQMIIDDFLNSKNPAK